MSKKRVKNMRRLLSLCVCATNDFLETDEKLVSTDKSLQFSPKSVFVVGCTNVETDVLSLVNLLAITKISKSEGIVPLI